jgi:hypothetical protein
MSINHREEAERFLGSSDTAMAAALEKDLPIEDQQHAAVLSVILTNRALTHATLAAGQEAQSWRPIVAGHLAEMLLDGTSDEVRKWARGIAFELQRVGIGLDEAIEARVQQLAPGTPPVQASRFPF